MSKFIKYPSIENDYRERHIQNIKMVYPIQSEFICLEKIHGANLGVIVDDEGVLIQSRNHVLKCDEKFYNMKGNDTDIQLAGQAMNLLFILRESCNADITRIIVYGELAGGSYEHVDVPANNDAPVVQKGVFYSPNQIFLAFDILYTIAGVEHFMDHDVVSVYCNQAGFDCVPELYRGTLDECLERSNTFETRVPKMYGLPRIPENICEGYVIKPTSEKIRGHNESRAIIKSKNDTFKEKSSIPKRQRKPQVELTPELQLLVDEAQSYIVEARLQNVLSHESSDFLDDRKNIGKLIGLFIGDAMKDFIIDNKVAVDKLSKAEKKVIQRALTQPVKEMILSQY